MWLEATCSDITKKEWDRLMKGARPLNYNWLVKKIKKELPDLYHDLRLDLWNPYSGATYVTKTHYILTSSSVEYFINKGESENIFENKQNKYVFNKMKKESMTISEAELRKLVYETTEQYLRENMEDEGWFDNAKEKAGAWWDRTKDNVSSTAKAAGKGIQGTVRGGLDQGRQMYNQSMADSSAASAEKNAQTAQQASQAMNAGYNKIPEVQKIASQYDAKIGKLQKQVSTLQAQKKQAMQQARKEYQSKMGTRASAYGKNGKNFQNTAQNSQQSANDMMNRRRASLGMEPVGQQQYGQVAESKLDKAIRKAIRETFEKQ